MRYTHLMGRGQATALDRFSAIFGDRRGSGREDATDPSLAGKAWVRSFWRGAGIKPLSGAAFVFPKRLDDDEQERILDRLRDMFGGNEAEGVCKHLIILGGGSLVHVARKELVEAPGLQKIADTLCPLLSPGMPQGEVRAMVPQSWGEREAMGRDVMIMRPAAGAE